MPNCPECETPLDFEVEDVEEGDILACDECGAEFEIVATEPLELAHIEGDDLDEDDEDFLDEEKEEE
uniref:Arg cluster protein n=1 Tax=mine drainage metagenome TaxID=410659 RepID=E6Q0B5_9ZZZZ